jgi:peptidoglycan/xylan/chitin deacetylase (PgdA/CDA1 family)
MHFSSLKNLAFAAASCAALLLAVSLGAIPSASKIRAPTCSCVAFRLDDIQDYFLDHVQLEVMRALEKRNASLTVSVIGNYFGSDPMIVNYVKSRAGNPSFEVANHGWNHEDFTIFSTEEQSALVQKTNKKIFDLLGVKPSVFIAPYNIINNNTFAAAKENDIRYINANVTYEPPYDIGSNQSLYRLPETVLIGDLNADDTYWITFGHQKVFDEVEDGLDRHGFAVVTMHPQDFAVRDMLNYQNMVDHSKMEGLEMLLDRIEEQGIKIVKISEISRYAAQEPDIYVQASSRPSKEEELAAAKSAGETLA